MKKPEKVSDYFAHESAVIDQPCQIGAGTKTAAHTRADLDARLAARVLAADPRSSALQEAAVVIAGGSRLDDKVKAARDAHAPIEALLRRHLAVASARRLPRDPLLGHLADRLPRQEPPR